MIATLLWVTGCGVSHVGDDGGGLAAAVSSDATPVADATSDADRSPDAAADSGADDPACLPRSTAMEFDELQERRVRASCEHDMACGSGWTDWANVEDCVRYGVANRQFVWERQRDAVVHGVLAIDPVASEACLQAIAVCEQPTLWLHRLTGIHYAYRSSPRGPCLDAFRLRCPAPEEGQPCATFFAPRFDCAPGLYCDDRTDRCNPTCRPQGGLGEPCTSAGDECLRPADGSWVWCDDDDLEPEPNGACRTIGEGPTAFQDEACGLVEFDGAAQLVRCIDGLDCLSAGAQLWTCQGPMLEGEFCGFSSFDQHCAEGLFCDPEDNLCAPRTQAHGPVPLGAPCTPDDACNAQYRTACVEGVCIEVGRSPGQLCDQRTWTSYDYRRCDAGMYCRWEAEDEERCTPLFPAGAACDPDDGDLCEGCCSEGRCLPWGECPPWGC